MIKKSFTLDDQLKFSKLSNDLNPIHLSKKKSRRYIYGEVIVYGINAILWGLEKWFEKKTQKKKIKNIEFLFKNPIFLDTNYDFFFKSEKNSLKISVKKKTKINILACIYFSDINEEISDLKKTKDLLKTPNDKDVIRQKENKLKIVCSHRQIIAFYPYLSKNLNINLLALLISTSYLVGMEVPGLNSLFSKLKIELNPKYEFSKSTFKVTKHDPRWSLIIINLNGKGFIGEITCFKRPKAIMQPKIKSFRNKIKKDEFTNINSLIIGGSRGLGELTAKIIVAGGGNAVFTYYHGKTEALEIAKELNIKDFFYDSNSSQKIRLHKTCNSIFFFSTPKILENREKKFDSEQFEFLKNFYLNGIKKILPNIEYKKIIFVFPSTDFINSNDSSFREYIKAKLECENFIKKNKNINFLIERLPQLNTDQNISLIKIIRNDNIKVLYKLLKKVQHRILYL